MSAQGSPILTGSSLKFDSAKGSLPHLQQRVGRIGNATGDFEHWTNHSADRGAVNDYQHYFVDVNGDGNADLIQVSRTSNNGWVGLATP
jgi:hypothetical protein